MGLRDDRERLVSIIDRLEEEMATIQQGLAMSRQMCVAMARTLTDTNMHETARTMTSIANMMQRLLDEHFAHGGDHDV